MSIYATDIRTARVMGLFTWSYVVGASGSRARRKMSTVKACIASYAITKGLLVSALSQNPVAAPPRFR